MVIWSTWRKEGSDHHVAVGYFGARVYKRNLAKAAFPVDTDRLYAWHVIAPDESNPIDLPRGGNAVTRKKAQIAAQENILQRAEASVQKIKELSDG